MGMHLDETKYLKLVQVQRIMQHCDRCIAQARNRFLSIRDAFLVELGLATGLRVHEMADLKCEDLQIAGGMHSMVVEHGKEDKRRVVRISERFKWQCRQFLNLKEQHGEPTAPDAPLFYSCRTGRALAIRTLQKSFKRVMKSLSLPEHFSIHALRHTYGTQLCRASGNNLKLVQDQMGHASIRSTEVYLHVEDEVLDRALETHALMMQGKAS